MSHVLVGGHGRVDDVVSDEKLAMVWVRLSSLCLCHVEEKQSACRGNPSLFLSQRR
jgi:hypothetical protein